MEVILSFLQTNHMIPDWLQLFDEMQTSGKMKHRKVLLTLETAITDSYGSDFAAEWLRRINILRPDDSG